MRENELFTVSRFTKNFCGKTSTLKNLKMYFLFVALAVCLFGNALGEVEVIQNGNFTLEYNLLNDTNQPVRVMSVTAVVRTLGWVGVGLSETPDMTEADLILGGVRNNSTYIGDYFAYGNMRPIEDLQQDILSYSATENATHTTLSFTRLESTGDYQEDVPLYVANYIIWAYGSSDSLSSYHGNVNRGSIPLRK